MKTTSRPVKIVIVAIAVLVYLGAVSGATALWIYAEVRDDTEFHPGVPILFLLIPTIVPGAVGAFAVYRRVLGPDDALTAAAWGSVSALGALVISNGCGIVAMPLAFFTGSEYVGYGLHIVARILGAGWLTPWLVLRIRASQSPPVQQ